MTIKILLVDDDMDNIFLLEELLHEENFEISSAPNGWLGFLKTKEIKPNLIISDLQMPVLNGYEFLRKIRTDQTLVNTPFILLTSYQDCERRDRAFQLGANAYLTKPVDFNVLLETITEQVRKKKLEKTVYANCQLC
ncbi:MAG: response regulator [Oscillatoria sp. PMC 1051.18]|nr:response regulator [Oscillatoria sp. PMC 1050.18]MEC5030984.1 response regulator [Oscillatoria sp. PMC 1051.18]